MCIVQNITTVGIAADTLFHFTNSLDSLTNILMNEFRPRFSLEGINVIGEVTDDEGSSHAIPMVCFCDLPVSRLHEHLEFYGSYGIGLSKEWGMRNGLSPVSYMYPGSTYQKCVKVLAHGIGRAFPEETVPDDPPHLVYDFVEMISFIKPYEGKVYRNGKLFNKRFYDEREWRWLPVLSRLDHPTGKDFQTRLTRNEWLDEHKRTVANEDVGRVAHLSFEPDDIKYLFISTEAEIIPFVEMIESIKGRKYNFQSVRKLTTRIMSSEQVRIDF